MIKFSQGADAALIGGFGHASLIFTFGTRLWIRRRLGG